MADFLTGAKLDRAVANAMGWRQSPMSTDWVSPTPGGGSMVGRSLPQFSTDPRHIAEMLAWLRSRSPHGIVNIEYLAEDETVVDCVGISPRVGSRLGCDIPDALARLVDAMKKEKTTDET